VIHEPELLFLDEPTSAVDPESRRDFWDKLFELADGGTTLLVSTHYMDEAERCHQLAILDHGALVANGSPDALTGALHGRSFEVASRQPRRAQEALRTQDGVLSVAQIGNSLRVLADAGAGGEATLQRLRRALPGPDDTIAPAQPNLEDVFVAATHREPA
jgi:ABC-2 type transport system ATP-binding protein